MTLLHSHPSFYLVYHGFLLLFLFPHKCVETILFDYGKSFQHSCTILSTAQNGLIWLSRAGILYYCAIKKKKISDLFPKVSVGIKLYSFQIMSFYFSYLIHQCILAPSLIYFKWTPSFFFLWNISYNIFWSCFFSMTIPPQKQNIQRKQKSKQKP